MVCSLPIYILLSSFLVNPTSRLMNPLKHIFIHLPVQQPRLSDYYYQPLNQIFYCLIFPFSVHLFFTDHPEYSLQIPNGSNKCHLKFLQESSLYYLKQYLTSCLILIKPYKTWQFQTLKLPWCLLEFSPFSLFFLP